ncbi:5881_t:CDS:1, partial [Funneliformis caledonium]
LDSIEFHSDDIEIDICYDETLVTSIISCHLNQPSQIINVHPKIRPL